MNTTYFKKLKNNILGYLLEFSDLQEKFIYLNINKKFHHLIKQSKNIKFFNNVIQNLTQYSIPNLLSNNSQKIEEFLSIELKKKKINDNISWSELLNAVIYFLSKKFHTNNKIIMPPNNHSKSHFYLLKSLKLSNLKNLSLEVENYSFSKNTGIFLGKILKRNQLVSLKISRSRFTKNALIAFKDFWAKNSCQEVNILRDLTLHNCYLTDFDTVYIMKILKSNNFDNLESLDLSNNSVEFNTIKFIDENFNYFKLRKLNLDFNRLSIKTITCLCNYLCKNRMMDSLSLINTSPPSYAFLLLNYYFFKKITSLKNIGITIKNLSNSVLHVFFAALIKVLKIEKMKISICEFSLNGMMFLSKYLESPYNCIRKIELMTIDFKFSFSKDFTFFLSSLKSNKSLETIKFNDCYFSQAQINTIFLLLSHKKYKSIKIEKFKFSISKNHAICFINLKKLSLRENEFNLYDGLELLEIFKNNTMLLETLDLSSNPYLFCHDRNDLYIINIIENLPFLKKFKLSKNILTHDEKENIKNYIVRSKRYLSVDF